QTPFPPTPRISTNPASSPTSVPPLGLLFIVVHDFVVGIHNVFFTCGTTRFGATGWPSAARRSRAGFGATGSIQRCACCGICLLKLVQCLADFVSISTAQGCLRPLNGRIQARLQACLQLIDPVF